MSDDATTGTPTATTRTPTATSMASGTRRDPAVDYNHPRFAGGGDADGNGFPADAPRRTPGRTVTIAVMLVALVAAAATRHVAVGLHRGENVATIRRTSASGASLAGMDSYAIALLLGGLRGPLVMVLWANSESQKTNRDLEGLDTQIEWIRLLQPEFDTVHIFQMWNKAYNISVQMVSLANKYTTILDAVDYGRSIDAERPDNLHIIKELGRIYADKLGNAYPERHYYRARVRRETMHRAEAIQKGQPGFQRLSHDALLDEAGKILPQFLQPTRQRPADLPEGAEFYDGSELQFLKQFEPFPYGVSPIALGYNYHKRGQVLAGPAAARLHVTLSASVIDSQPALALRSWAEEEWERGRKLEFKALGMTLPDERIDQEVPTSTTPPDPAQLKDASDVPEMLHAYGMAVRLAEDSRLEYERHLSNPEFVTKRSLYASHLDTLLAMRSMAAADAAYIQMMTAPDAAERTRFGQLAAQHYRNAIREYGLISLRYYTPAGVLTSVLPPGVTRATVGTGAPGSRAAVTEEDVLRMLDAVRLQSGRRGISDMNAEDRLEYERYIERAIRRLRQLEDAANRPA